MSIINANIHNLTSLWKKAGMAHESFFPQEKFDYCFIDNSDWPNRIWFNQSIDNELITIVKEKISSIAIPLTIAYWNTNKNSSFVELESHGFTKLFEQVGMSLKLTKPLQIESNLETKLVSNKTEANTWAKIFEKSFGYRILPDTIIKTISEFDYYIAYSQNTAVGTAISYKTNDIIGVHSVGIPPEMRRKGYAKQIMKLLINDAIKKGCEYMTLQASDMGKNLYLSLGFKEEFVIINYSLENKV
jgi:ribosomal protein S18 acetylase RimI-like enzyme